MGKIRKVEKVEKVKKIKTVIQSMALCLGFLPLILQAETTQYYGNLVPDSGDNNLYYAIGGGSIVPNSPAVTNSVSIPLSVDASLNMDCGKADPTASITNSINGITNSFQNIFNSMVTNAQGAIMQMPAYLISRNNPSLYQMLQNGYQSGQEQFGLATKSCQQVQSEIAQGKNPYQNFAKLSMQNDWKKSLSNAGSMFQSSSPSTRSASSGGVMSYSQAQSRDINEIQSQVTQDGGKNGIPWVEGSTTSTVYAGGEGQPKIQLTHDTTIAGVNAIIGKTSYGDNASIPQEVSLSHYWKDAAEVSKFSQSVLGENTITTYDSGDKSSTPGKGLIPQVKSEFDKIYPKLQEMVNDPDNVSIDQLKALSTTSIILNKSLIKLLANEQGVMQNVQMNAVAQGIASAIIVDKAQMLIQILQTALQVPVISSNESAKEQIRDNIATLESQIDMVVNYKETNEKLVLSTLKTITANQQIQQINAAVNRPSQSLTIPSDGVISTATPSGQ